MLLMPRKRSPAPLPSRPPAVPLPVRRSLTPLAALALLAAPWPAPAVATAPADTRAAQAGTAEEVALRARLGRSMRLAGRASGAYVRNATDRVTLFRWRAGTPRALASNTKLFTTAAVLDRLGPGATLPSTVLAEGPVAADGTLTGDLVLRGGSAAASSATSRASTRCAVGRTRATARRTMSGP